MTTIAPLFVALALAVPGAASAQARGATRRGRAPRAAAPSAAPQAPPVAPTVLDAEPPSVAAPDAESAIQLIQTAAVAGNAAGARSIALLVLRGLPPRAAAAGLDALGVLGRAEGSAAVERMLEHRRVSLRRHAVAAAQAIHTPALAHALTGTLRDADEDVRVEAAAALGETGTRDAIPALMSAFQRDLEASLTPEGGRLTHEAAKAVARVGNADEVGGLLEFLRRAPFRTMADAMRLALGRRDLPDAFKLRVVSAVGDLATPEVKTFLNTVVTDAHGQDNAVVRAARTAAERIAD